MAQTYLDIDRTLAFTALLDMSPEFRKMTTDEAEPVTAALAAAMTEASPKDRWEFARRWIAHRQECPDCGCSQA